MSLEDEGFEKIGTFFVDAGCVAVGDPSYLCDVKDWSGEVMKAYDNGNQFGPYGLSGIVLSSGLGDGTYSAYAKFVEVPGWGRRIAELRVVFIEDVDAAASFMDAVAGVRK